MFSTHSSVSSITVTSKCGITYFLLINFRKISKQRCKYILPVFDCVFYCNLSSLCVIGLASTHVAFKDEGGITSVDFNVGKSDRSGVKVTGKRKKVQYCNVISFGKQQKV